MRVSALSILCMLTFLAACNAGKKSDSADSKPGARSGAGSNGNPPGQNVKCQAKKVLEILPNGRTAVSMLSDQRRELLMWNIFSREVGKRMFFPTNYLEISPNGDFLVRQVSFKRFQLVRFGKNGGGESKVFHINSLTEPKVSFSPDSRYLIIKSRPYNLNFSDRIMVYDINYESYLPTFEDDFLNVYKMTKDSQALLVGVTSGVRPFVLKLNAINMRRAWRINFPRFQPYSDLTIGENSFLVKTEGKFFVYDLETGKLRYDIKDQPYFHGLSIDGRFALFTSNLRELSIRELDTGLEIRKASLPDNIYLSSCKLDDESLKLYCINKNTQNQIVIWNPATGEKADSCI